MLAALAVLALFVAAVMLVGNKNRVVVTGKDHAELFRKLLPFAEAGDRRAQYSLGMLYFQGLGTDQDDRAAVEWIRRAAEKGYAPAQDQLGVLYHKGRGVERSDVVAKEWMHKAAEQGDATAQFNLAVLLDSGMTIRRDDPAARALVERISQADAPAHLKQWEQASLRDESEAIRWYEKAVAQGHRAAHINLGNMLRERDSAYQDYGRAMKLYEAVANLREEALEGQEEVLAVVFARYNIAIMYERGQKVLPNPERAKEWRCKAVAAGRRLPKMPWIVASDAKECPAAD